MKLYLLPKSVWIASHVLIILSLIFATICLHSVLPGTVAGFATAAIWCFAGGLCVLLVPVFAQLAAKK
jgi:hypothetical protein